MVGGYFRFGGICYLHLQATFTLKIVAALFLINSVTSQESGCLGLQVALQAPVTGEAVRLAAVAVRRDKDSTQLLCPHPGH
jgi:hypothetical protein